MRKQVESTKRPGKEIFAKTQEQKPKPNAPSRKKPA